MSMTGNERSYIKQSRRASTWKYISTRRERENRGFAFVRSFAVPRVLIAVSIYNSDACVFCSCISLITIFPPVNLPTRSEIPLARFSTTVAVLVVKRARLLFSLLYRPLCSRVTLIRQKRQGRKQRVRADGVRENPRETSGGAGRRATRGVTGVRTERAFIRVRHVFPRWLLCAVASLERTLSLDETTARSGLIEREISPQTNREVAMRKFPP